MTFPFVYNFLFSLELIIDSFLFLLLAYFHMPITNSPHQLSSRDVKSSRICPNTSVPSEFWRGPSWSHHFFCSNLGWRFPTPAAQWSPYGFTHQTLNSLGLSFTLNPFSISYGFLFPCEFPYFGVALLASRNYLDCLTTCRVVGQKYVFFSILKVFFSYLLDSIVADTTNATLTPNPL